MTRTVRDAAILLTAMAGVDANDAATAASAPHAKRDYTSCWTLAVSRARGSALPRRSCSATAAGPIASPNRRSTC